ncbi:hypothetical protein ACLKA6_001646 [Drosophila palustris]
MAPEQGLLEYNSIEHRYRPFSFLTLIIKKHATYRYTVQAAGPEKLAALVRRTAEDFGYCFQIARAREGEARSRRWYSRRMEREVRCQMRYYGAPALEISMEPSGRSGVAPPPNSPRGSEDSRGTEPNTLDMGPVQTLSPVRVGADRERPDAARPAVGWGQTNWVAAPATWQLQGLDRVVPVSLLDCVARAQSHACGRPVVVRIRTGGRAFLVRLRRDGIVRISHVPKLIVFFLSRIRRKQSYSASKITTSRAATRAASLAEPPRSTTKLQPSSAATRAGSATSWLCRHERGQNFKRANSAPRVRTAATSWCWRHKGEQ